MLKNESVKNFGKHTQRFRMGDIVRFTFTFALTSLVRFTGLVTRIRGSGMHQTVEVWDPVEGHVQHFFINHPNVLKVEVIKADFQTIDRGLIREANFKDKPRYPGVKIDPDLLYSK